MLYKYLTTMKIIPSRSIFILLAYLTCCIWAWPAAAPSSLYRRNFNANSNYIPFTSNVAYEPADYQQMPQQESYNYNTQWDRAKEPLSYYDLLDDYMVNQPSSGSDTETYSNLDEFYDPPVWGQIVKEKPESELEELKVEEREREAVERRRAQEEIPYQYYAYDKRGQTVPVSASQHHAPAVTTIHPSSSTTGKSVATTPSIAHQPVPITSTPKVVKPVKLLHQQPGQKEVPMLRPPYKGKMVTEHQHSEVDNHDIDDEPVIAVAQRSAVDKPSAYDTLRKYISLEDALKKEAEKRKTTSSRLQKRDGKTGIKKIVTDVNSLSGQLTNLKKSVA